MKDEKQVCLLPSSFCLAVHTHPFGSARRAEILPSFSAITPCSTSPTALRGGRGPPQSRPMLRIAPLRLATPSFLTACLSAAIASCALRPSSYFSLVQTS